MPVVRQRWPSRRKAPFTRPGRGIPRRDDGSNGRRDAVRTSRAGRTRLSRRPRDRTRRTFDDDASGSLFGPNGRVAPRAKGLVRDRGDATSRRERANVCRVLAARPRATVAAHPLRRVSGRTDVC